MPRILIVVKDGFAGYVCDKDSDIDVEIFDFDVWANDPQDHYLPPPHFKDLCEVAGVPTIERLQ